MAATYTFCELAHQTGIRWHIRQLEPAAGLHPHGGIPAGQQALCTLSVARGWDVAAEFSTLAVQKLLQCNQQARRTAEIAVCASCADTYLHSQRKG